jgi:hypothetical protein
VFARSRPVFFDARRGARSRRRVPRWLWLLLCGGLAGAAGVVLVQQRVLPPRLSSAQSAALQQAFAQADGQRSQLQAEHTRVQQRAQQLAGENAALSDALVRSRSHAERLREDLAAAMPPPDPRGGSVEVRAAQFNVRDGALDYRVVLTRDGAAGKVLAGVLQFTVAGESARGVPAALALQPIALALGRHEVLRGSVPLPEGFKPRQTTVQVLDRAAGKALGMRVLKVR